LDSRYLWRFYHIFNFWHGSLQPPTKGSVGLGAWVYAGQFFRNLGFHLDWFSGGKLKFSLRFIFFEQDRRSFLFLAYSC